MISDEYKYRINKVIDFIENNLQKEFTLFELASVANFSKFHFSRIFRGIIGETPFQLILRLRIERAASFLIHRQDSITDIAYNCGFKNLSVFSKNFKAYFNCSASQYRKKNKENNFNKINNNPDKQQIPASAYFCNNARSLDWKVDRKINQGVEVKELQNISVIYLRHVGPYQGDANLFEGLFGRLFSWASPRGILEKDFDTVVVYHDDATVADKNKLRTSICITASEDTKIDGEIGKMMIEKGKYVVGRFKVKPAEFQDAWDWMLGEWFPSSRYQPDEKPCFEYYREEPQNGTFVVDICIPVKKL